MTQYSGKVIRRNPVTPTQQSASGVWKLTDQAAAIRNNTWPIAGVPDPISRSVRLRSSASAYFNRTPAIAGNRRTWTWSGWVKRGAISSSGYYSLFSAGTTSPTYDGFRFGLDSLQFFQAGGNSSNLVTTSVYRDPSAWYHIVLALDTTQATSSNRVKIYVNGVQITSFSTASYPSLNLEASINNTLVNVVGAQQEISPDFYFDGYLTEINFIDGQALTPSSFGTTDSLTGAWIPLPYTGTYGTNGFYLDFRDNTSTTTLGLDYSGNSNNWTANNVSLTAGTTYDSMLDVPTPWIGYSATTDTSAVTRGNYAVLNPLLSAGGTTANGNLQVTTTVGVGHSRATIALPTSGKWYAEFTAVSASSATDYIFGIVGADTAEASYGYTQTPSYSYTAFGERIVNGTFTPSFYSSYTTGDVIGCAVNLDANEITWYKNGVAQTAISIANGSYFWMVSDASGSRQITAAFNAGQRPLSYSPPTGFKTLCATNLPQPTILNGAQFMAATLYTGTGSSQTIANTVNGVNFQPDFVWMKSRSAATDHGLYDAVRGVQLQLESNTTTAETTETTGLTAFTSTGFTVGALAQLNTNTATYVGWQWNAGGSNATNTSGTITSTVRASTTAGFSVVTFTGNGSTGTVGHGLGVAPSMIIQKPRNSTGSWAVYHASLGAGNAVWLNLTDASASYPTVWNSTTPTSSVYSVGSYMGTSNYVAYCFAQIAGFSAFGSYTGNGSSDGPFLHFGFRARWIMYKRTDSTGQWNIIDTARNTFNQLDTLLRANLSNADETNAVYAQDITANGWKIRSTNVDVNTNGATYIYAAFAENPFKFANAR